ncbi:UV radiation resistance protein and autophagy-related subunit 14-domain-containing protein [Sparassis latifolia]
MECQNCELKQRQFYCESCLRQHLLSFRLQTNHLATDRDAHIASAQRALVTVVDPARLIRADLKGTEERVRELWEGVDEVRKVNEKTRERLRNRRSTFSARRRTIAIASSTFNHPPTPSTSASPPQAFTPTPPGSYPSSHDLPHSPVSTSPQSSRPIVHRRGSSSSSVPGSSTIVRPAMSGSRTAQPLPSRPTLSILLTSPHAPLGVSSPIQARPGYAASNKSADSLTRQIDEATYQLAALSDTLARARSGLVQELVEVFSIVEVGGRPPLGGKAGTKGEWTIGGLVLPVPGDIRRYPPDHINAVLTHTLHFLSLLAFYLGIKLPFEVIWSRSTTPPLPSSSNSSSSSANLKGNGLLGVGIPWLGACKGGESGGWARWSAKHPLHVSSSSPATPSTTAAPPTGSNDRASRPGGYPRPASKSSVPSSSSSAKSTPTRSNALSASLADSQLEDLSGTGVGAGTSTHNSSFTTALAMLLYNVCYLAHTQAVDVPLAQAGEVLGNLWAVCCSQELGRKSHETHPLLPAPTPPSFPLDFAQLLQATAANPTRPRARGTTGRETHHAERIVEEDEDGWDLVDADGAD